MSTDTSVDNNDSEEWTLEDLNHYWMPDGLPVFIADFEEVCDVVESLGFNIYYLLANQEKEITPKASSTVTYSNTTKTAQVTPPVPQIVKNAQLFKVVNNFVGRSVSIANTQFPDNFLSTEENCTYNMPLIPHIFVEKLDQFFRLVDAQHGTESIVLLTYDLNKEGPQGWGILVPDQTNTSVHCNYDPHSIAEIKPDNVMIVGSVHSHPGMAAYASGTDHADQADFDGLHITFGWQKSVNNGATQYHVELQMAGSTFTLSPHDVFEDIYVEKAPDPEVVEWTSKVKKVSPPMSGGSMVDLKHLHTQPVTPMQESMVLGTTKSLPFTSIRQFTGLEPNAIIIAEVDKTKNGTLFCPCCDTIIDDRDLFFSYCDFCKIPFAQKNERREDTIDNLSYFCKRFSISENGPAYLWCSDQESREDFFIRLTSTTLIDEIASYEKAYNITTTDYVKANHPDVSINDLQTFENITASINLYQTGSKCVECENFYDLGCPYYKEQLNRYIQDTDVDIYTFENTINGEYCTEFVSYTSASDSLYYN